MAWAQSKDFRVPLVPPRPTACQGDYIVPTLENKKCFHSQESGQVLLTLGLGVALPSVVGYVGAVRESKVLLVHHLSCQPLISISQSFNLPLSTSHQVLLVLYLSPLLLAWGLQLLILLLLPALQSSIYKGLSSLASTSLSFYQVHGPDWSQSN